ncbi:MAG: succinate dehydrogenase [Flavobacteriales bacterium BRH_c54]|nr:MAG: succinate dehydrogenase [Flavobacteriales bacterium BRH_c54]
MSKGFSTSSVGRKILMALSGFFLLFFLLQHFVINFLSVLSADAFNETSHFMGTNPLIQYILQPILLFGVLFHLGMGIYLDLQNKKARPVKYAMNKPGENASWMSRNMIITGIMIMLFLGLHFYDFWIPEIKDKFIDGIWDNPTKYYEHLVHKFADPVRVGIYVLAFVFLALHLLHGFQSAFQSVGFNHRKYTPIIKKLGTLYAIIIPLGFIFIAIFHFINHSH